MKNIFAFIVVAAAVVAIWFFMKKPANTTTTTTTEPPANPLAIMGDVNGKQVVLGNILPINAITPNANVHWSNITAATQTVGGNCASLPPALRAECMGLKPAMGNINIGLISGYTGNGSLELFSGNGALEMYTGAPNNKPAKKPSCFSIWKHNVENPNGPLMAAWPGLNCVNSNRI